LLSDSDQLGYYTLQGQILSLTESHHRGLRAAIFTEALGLVRTWAQRGDPDDWKRCLVCGLYYLNAGVAVNAHQLQFLTRRCKSAINGALKLMGYITISARGDVNPDLVCALPILKGNTRALRQWSVRRADVHVAKECRRGDATPTSGGQHGTETPLEEIVAYPENFGQGQDDPWSWDRFLF
jgi:hypothetical protein